MNESLKMQFAVDTLNVRGNLRVRVMKECLPREKEVARLDIPIFNLLDCICDVDGDGYYDRWFSLVLGTESVPAEGELEKQKQSVLPERPSHHKFEYHPCIRLRMRWIAREGIERINDSKLYCRIQLPFFSVAVIDSEHAREVMQISIDNVEARHSVTTDFTDTSVNIMWMQVDNQLPNPVSPVIVAPTRVKYPQPVLRLHLRKKNLLSKESLTSYETFQLIIQELDLKLEQQTVIASWELIKSWLQERRQSNDSTHSDEQIAGSSMDNLGFATCYDIVQYELLPTLQNNFTLLQRLNANTVGNERNQLNINSVGDGIKRSREKRRPALLDTESVEADDERKLYVEDFKIYPIKINVSFLTTPQVISQSEKYEHRSSIRNEGTAGLYSTASLFMWQVGEVVLDLTSSISDAPLSFNGFVAPHLFKSEVEVAKRLQEHYLHWAYFQLYKIVGSLDVVGNPIGLLSSLGVGVKDFFYEPAHALITSPTEIRKIGRTFFKGALSLVSNTTAGFVGTGVTITRSIGRGVAKLSMDDSYMKVREKLQKPPRSIRAAALRPAKDLGYGFLHGIVGLVRVPYSHVRRKGFGALLPGVVKGIVGIAADPVVGTLDALTHSGDAVRDMLKYSSKIPNEPIQRMRLSELFGVDGRILPYNFTIALGTYVMQALDRSTDESLIIGQSDDGTSAIFRNAKSIIRRTAKQDAVSLNPTSTNRLSLVHQYNSARKGTLDSGSTSDGRNGQPHASMNLMRRLSLRGYEDYNSPASYLSEYFGDDDQSKYAETAVSEGDPPESVGKEFVIYTGIIRKLPGMDLVVVVSTARVIITEYHRKQKGAYLKIQWVALLKSMEPPEFQKSGGGCSLTLTAGKAHTRGKGRSSLSSSKVPRRSLRSEPSQIGSLYTLEGGYHEEDMLINISNCINTLLGNFLRLLPMQGNRRGDCEEDEFGIVHIGAWQFAKESSLNEQIDRSVTSDPGYSTEEIYNVINELEKEQWMFGVASRASGSSDVNEAIISIPKWLREEQLAAIKSHANVADVFTYLEENYQQLAKRVYTKAAVEQLMRGIVSFEEFKEVISGKNQHEDNDSITDSKCEVKKKKKKMSLLSLVGVGNTVKRGSSGILKPAVDDIADDESVASSTAGSYSRISNVFSFSAKSLGAAASLVLPGNNRGIHRNGSTSNSPDPTKISSDNLYDMNSLDKLSANNKFPFANYSRERSLVDKNFEGKNISFENGWSTSPNNSGSAKPYTIYETENEQSGSSSLKHPAVFKAIDSGNKGLRMDIQEILEEKEDDDEDSDGERTVIQTRKHLTKGGDNHSGAFQTSAEKLMASDTSFSYSDLNSAISRGIQTPDSLNAFEEGFMSAKDGNINQTPLLHFSDGFAVILSKSETHQKADLPIPLRENPLFQKKRDRLHSPQSSSAELAIQQVISTYKAFVLSYENYITLNNFASMKCRRHKALRSIAVGNEN